MTYVILALTDLVLIVMLLEIIVAKCESRFHQKNSAQQEESVHRNHNHVANVFDGDPRNIPVKILPNGKAEHVTWSGQTAHSKVISTFENTVYLRRGHMWFTRPLPAA